VPADDATAAIPGAVPAEAPAPLLANYGVAKGLGYSTDIIMMSNFNGQVRNVKAMAALLASTGWELVKVTRTEGPGCWLAVPA